MKQYLDLCNYILQNGRKRSDRTGTGTISIFGYQMRFNLQEGFPLVTTKKMHLKGIVHELLWFLNGSTNNNELNDVGVNIWNEWALSKKDIPCKRRAMAVVDQSKWFSLVYDSELDPKSAAALERQETFKWDSFLQGDGLIKFMVRHGIPCTEEIVVTSFNDRVRCLMYDYYMTTRDPESVLNTDKLPGLFYVNHQFGKTETDHLINLMDMRSIPVPSNFKVGDLGPIYGWQWREWRGDLGVKIDQIKELIETLKTRPFSRRHIVSAWNVADLPNEAFSPQENVMMGKMALAPCHTLYQFYVTELTDEERQKYWNSLTEGERNVFGEAPKYGLSCQLYQRSADIILGVPYNIASYALLTSMIAQVCKMIPFELVHTFGDAHIYLNHVDKFKLEQVDREPHALPRLKLNPFIETIDDFCFSDITLENYTSHPTVSYPISV